MDVATITYPAELPISAWREDIVAALRAHQVVVVAGETGSGKSTQLPKMCLEAGVGGSDRIIGHTQPRRVAARTIAERVASELGVDLGNEVGYSVRFTDTVSDDTQIKVMTDGILLAEIQRDRDLSRYGTLIIDEAHERSLNIDFILGYVKQLLPRRPDLTVVVTSATIDTERFAAHFTASDGSSAPIIEVSGRTYPVEVRYRPFGPDAPSPSRELVSDPSTHEFTKSAGGDERDQVQAIVDACDELRREGPGDILVFLSGEREIHDTADAIRRLDWPRTDVLPLYARLSAQEQHRIFDRSRNRKIVLSTNVAETSITVPGVRYVVDTGTARISRYSRRLKVQRLPIEPVSKASANQRAGRCGRVAPGICIRLYGEDDFDARPDFTEPEILRTNLASVILQMAAIGLGDVAAFPFVEAPDSRTIRDGEQLLTELGAIRTPGVRLTRIGRKLARLPIDPRLGRMVLEAERHDCVREVLVIAAGLSIRDVRERPEEHREKANELHQRFRVRGSDLLSMVALWDHLRTEQRNRSGNQFRRMCRDEFLNYVRVREWMDLYSQLRRVAGDLGIRPRTAEAHPDAVHKAVLAGFLSHVGVYDPVRRVYRGARQSEFVVARGSSLGRNPPEWVLATELVETSRLFARQVATIDPTWAEEVGAHITKRSHGEPRWDPTAGRAIATERVTLLGLPIVDDRTIGLDRVDPDLARSWFITRALSDGEVPEPWRRRQRFLAHNAQFLDRLSSLSARARRAEVFTHDDLYDFYDARIPHDITSIRHFDRWWKNARRRRPDRLDLTDDVVQSLTAARGRSVSLDDFPDVWRQGDLELPITYRDAPGEPLDGVTIHVPLTALNQVDEVGFDWNVPGHRRTLVTATIEALPKEVRRALSPLGPTIEAVLAALPAPQCPATAPEGSFVDAFADALAAVTHANRPRGSSAADVATSAGDVGEQSSGVDGELDRNRHVLALAARAARRRGDTGASTAVSPAQVTAAYGRIDPWLRPTFVVSDDAGEVHAVGTDLAALQEQLAPRARDSIASTIVDTIDFAERRGITDWDMGDLSRQIHSADRDLDVVAYPTLLDVGDSVALRLVTSPELQQRAMRSGVRRLLLLNAAPSRAAVERLMTDAGRLVVARSDISLATLIDDCIAATVDAVIDEHGALPWTRAEYDELRSEVRAAAGRTATVLARAAQVVAAAVEVQAQLAGLQAGAAQPSVADANDHLGRLVRPGFVLHTGVERLDDVERYVRGIGHRLATLAGGIERDRRRMGEVRPLEERHAALVDRLGRGADGGELAELGWQLEELRVATFAQALGVKGQVSSKRLRRALDRIERDLVTR